MKASDLRDRTTEDLVELERSLSNERFSNRFKNYTNRLDDTSVIRKSKRDLARIKLILSARARGAQKVEAPVAEVSAETTAPVKAPKAKAAEVVAEAAAGASEPVVKTAAPESAAAPSPAPKKAKEPAAPKEPKAPAAAKPKKPAAKKSEKGE